MKAYHRIGGRIQCSPEVYDLPECEDMVLEFIKEDIHPAVSKNNTKLTKDFDVMEQKHYVAYEMKLGVTPEGFKLLPNGTSVPYVNSIDFGGIEFPELTRWQMIKIKVSRFFKHVWKVITS